MTTLAASIATIESVCAIAEAQNAARKSERRDMRVSEEEYTEMVAKRSRWTRGAVVGTDGNSSNIRISGNGVASVDIPTLIASPKVQRQVAAIAAWTTGGNINTDTITDRTSGGREAPVTPFLRPTPANSRGTNGINGQVEAGVAPGPLTPTASNLVAGITNQARGMQIESKGAHNAPIAGATPAPASPSTSGCHRNNEGAIAESASKNPVIDQRQPPLAAGSQPGPLTLPSTPGRRASLPVASIPSSNSGAAAPAPYERDVLAACLQALDLHPRVAWAHRMNCGGMQNAAGQYVKFGFKGMADITGQLRDGRRLEVECKRPGESLTLDQQAFLHRVIACGGVAFVARGVDDVMKALKS